MRKVFFLLLFVAFAQLPAFADVDLKTGDFHVRYADIDYAGVKGAVIDRTYNSASQTVGLFGYGWTSVYETKLYVIGDGNILVKEVGSSCKTCAENGSGNASILIREKGFFELFFTPREPDQAKTDLAVNQLIPLLIRDRKLENSPVAIAKKRKELLASMSQRAAEWITYTEKGWLTPVALPAQSKWFSTNGELQSIDLKDNTFTRYYNDKSYESFNAQGFLQNKYDYKGKLVYEITYTANKISQITDGAGNVFKFQLNSKGLVTAIQANKDKATFEYNAANCLVKSVSPEKVSRTYTYDARNIMTGIKEPENKIAITYDPRTSRVTSTTEDEDEDAETITYRYSKLLKEDGSIDPYRFATTKIRTYASGEYGDSTYNEYELREILGRPYTYKTIITDNNYTTETVFTECGCGPLSIRKGGSYANFKYDGKSRMIQKDNGEYLLNATYNDDQNKISRIERTDKETDEVQVTEYFYSPDGDLIKMQSKDIVIELAYDANRNIVKMNAPEAILHFKYNSINKPIEILMDNVGSIQVLYDDKGEIEKVESPEGHTMSLKVTQAFQELLTLAKPQGFDYKLR